MMRWLIELLSPALKCARIGHGTVRRETRYALVPTLQRFSSVADKITEKRVMCTRCRADIAPWHETDRQTLQSLTMTDEQWTTLRRGGRVDL